MTSDDRHEALLIESLKSREYSDPGPARLEFERRRFLARVSQEERRPARLAWRTVLVGGFAGAGAVAAAAVLLLVFASPDGIGGSDSEVRLSGVWQLEAGDAVAQGTPIRVPETGRASLVLPDGTVLWVGPGTRMAVEQSDGSRIRVDSGRVLARVQPRTAISRFEVVTPDTKVQVHGTVFSVAVVDEHTTVRLHDGAVRLVCGGKSLAMEAGHRVVASGESIVSMETFGEQEARIDLELGDGAGIVRDTAPPLVATAPTMTSDDLESGKAPVEPVISGFAPTESTLGDESGESRSPTAARTGAATGKKRPALHDRVVAAWNGARYAEIVELTEGTDESTLLFYRARSLSRLGRWGAAAELYVRVAAEDQPRKAEALYRAADAFKRAKLYPNAIDLANQAISVGGPNADHAWGIKLGALTRIKQYQAASAAAGEYLDLFPGGAHVGEAYFVQGTGQRLGKKWRAAAHAYGNFLSRGTGPAAMREDASFYYGYCQLRAGDVDAGRKSLENYIVEFPRGRHVNQAQSALVD